MNKKTLSFIALAAGIFAIIVALFVIFAPNLTDDGKLRVTASSGVWGGIAKQIGGDHVNVTSILDDPTADPHLYESGAKDASSITRADVVIANGLGYDDFMDKVLETAPNSDRAFVKVSDVLKVEANTNPHLWYDIQNIQQVAGAFEAAMSSKDPTNAGEYKKNLSIFVDSLQPLIVQIDAIRAQHPGAAIAETERVAGYLLDAINLRVVSPESFATAIEEGTEPSPSDQTAMRDLITHKKIEALVYNDQAESEATRTLRALAEENGVPVVSVSETPAKDTRYQEWQQGILESLMRALNS
jgi:zinc/manganese transport system substrate-binding protein